MAIGSTIHTFAVQLADVDRGVYEALNVRVARHPSETDAFMVTRLLAYCLEYEEGIEFGGGVSTAEDPAVLVRDLTGNVTAWIEVGAPDAARVHYGSKLAAQRAAVYTHRDPEKLLASWAGKTIHKAENLRIRSFEPTFITQVVAALERRNTLTFSVTEGHMYLELNDMSLDSPLHEHHID